MVTTGNLGDTYVRTPWPGSTLSPSGVFAPYEFRRIAMNTRSTRVMPDACDGSDPLIRVLTHMGCDEMHISLAEEFLQFRGQHL